MKRLCCISLTVIVIRLNPVMSDAWQRCRAPEFYTQQNRSLCAVMNPCSIFQSYGYRVDDIPPDLSTFDPPLLHEDAILHAVGANRQFRSIGNGTFATVYLAELRDSGKLVVVKTFRPKYQDYSSLDLEFRIHEYLEPTEHVPEVLGLLPTGPGTDQMSLVIEYVQNSITVAKLLRSEHIAISACFWLHVCLEIAKVLQTFHAKYVIHSDLHANNVLIQWREKEFKVYIIDFGGASFRCGRHHRYSISSYPFLAPELTYETSSPASDVYALGNILRKGEIYVNSSLYTELMKQCHHIDKQSRPQLDDVITRLQTISSKCGNVTDFVPHLLSFDLKRNAFRNFSPPVIPALAFHDISDPDKWRPLSDYYVRVLEHVPSKKNVIVKYTVDRSFLQFQEEAMFHMYLGDTGYVLKLVGLATLQVDYTEVAIVLEFFAQRVTLFDLLNIKQCRTFSFLLALALDLSKAVMEIHKKYVIISNLAPTSVLVDISTGEPKVKIYHLSNASFVGIEIDSNHHAPEVVEGDVTTFASDVYTLGVILSDILEGEKDLTDELQSVIKKCKSEKPELRPTVSQVVEFIILSINERIQTRIINIFGG